MQNGSPCHALSFSFSLSFEVLAISLRRWRQVSVIPSNVLLPWKCQRWCFSAFSCSCGFCWESIRWDYSRLTWIFLFLRLQLNIAYPATGCQKLVDVEDERKLWVFFFLDISAGMVCNPFVCSQARLLRQAYLRWGLCPIPLVTNGRCVLLRTYFRRFGLCLSSSQNRPDPRKVRR